MSTNIDKLKAKIPDELWNKYFPAKNDKELPDNEFEIGLVLGGTVSAGAYTAGVLDFLIEALDTWQTEKERNPGSTPSWMTRISILTGTSGGGVLAAMTAKALSWEFSPVRSPERNSSNPFYKTWVEALDIYKMLETGDLKEGKLRSLLNSDCLENAAHELKTYSTAVRRKRNYVPEPLPIILTLTNLRGIPYRTDFGDEKSQSFVDHGDYARFHIFTHGGNGEVRPDSFGVSESPLAGYLGWEQVIKFALGTGAFPIGFPFQELTRPLEHYRYRPVIIPGDGHKASQIRPLEVDWHRLISDGASDLNDNYHFLCADGGMWNNQPIELCRRELAGMLGRNPRNGLKATRAVVLIDPFMEAPSHELNQFKSLLKGAEGVLSAWTNQARYNSRDQILAAEEDCFSRFMVTPRGPQYTGGKAIASASLGAFGGFLCRDYREHDFFLGRKNCQDFLRHAFVLPTDHKLFAAWKSENSTQALALEEESREDRDNEKRFLPLIPLFGACKTNQVVPDFPCDKFNQRSNSFQDALKSRVDALYEKIKDENGMGWMTRRYLNLGMKWGGGRTEILDMINELIKDGLKSWGLSSKDNRKAPSGVGAHKAGPHKT